MTQFEINNNDKLYDNNIYNNKLSLIKAGEKPRVLDLFAGCGGLSLGFTTAGFNIIESIEIDHAAVKTYNLNFENKTGQETKSSGHPIDITRVDPEDLFLSNTSSGSLDSCIDIIIGGPPCQAFARVGRAKLREVAAHPEAFLLDERSNLYLRYLDYVKKLKPIALLMENVPDILNFGGHNVAEEICEVLEDLGYEPHYSLLNAVYYGVPQMRERMFLLAYRKELKIKHWFPKPTHYIQLPSGYNGTRQVALQTIKNDLFDRNRYFIEFSIPEKNTLLPGISSHDALSDLPVISQSSPMKNSKGPRYFSDLSRYQCEPQNEYQSQMRKWPGFESSEGIFDHVIRYLPRDYKIFARMKPGDQYPEAYLLAQSMFDEALRKAEASLERKLLEGDPALEELKRAYLLPYDPGKFPNKWRKMEANLPARTLMAHLGKDSYSHIHYDSSQERTISVREAARLQSFPDGFKFFGPMNPAFKQIGNAVPPLLAKAIAEIMLSEIRSQ